MTDDHMRQVARRVDLALDAESYLRLQARSMTEWPALTTQVVRGFRQCGWRVKHDLAGASERGRVSQRAQGHPGAPDIFAVHSVVPVAAHVELKRWGQGRRSEPGPEQQEWLDLLGAVAGVYAACWTTYDWLQRWPQALIADPTEVLRLATEGTTTP